jgi:hypothetical protein
MNNKIILVTVLVFLKLSVAYSQQNKLTENFNQLDNSFFKWKDFSFIQSWEKLKKICDLEKIDEYKDDLLNAICGEISEIEKHYYLNNEKYHEFNGEIYDKVILKIEGSKISAKNNSSLFFIKKFSDSSSSITFHKKLLSGYKLKFGNNATSYNKLERVKDSAIIENISSGHSYDSLQALTVEETQWRGKKNIKMTLTFLHELNIIVLEVSEYVSKVFVGNNNSINFFKDSEYDENFYTPFKEFDKKNGYKNLKFGMPKSVVKNIVKFKEPDILKQYRVVNNEYKNWFYIPFDNCDLRFNKKAQLYEITLTKYDEYSDDEYEQFLNELISLFGNSTEYKEKSDNLEYSMWKGKNFNFLVFRFKEKNIAVQFVADNLDDSLPSDKLY